MRKTYLTRTTVPDLFLQGTSDPPVPNQIGPYKIEGLLNKGGMSLLYLATHPDMRGPLAIKVLSPKYLQHKEMVGRFLKEAKIISLTDHPNIIRLYGQGKWENGLYIAMEFIQGVSLKQFILQKSLSHKKAMEVILQVAYALCHLHNHGVIHRDLKPENILITETGDVKVIDFGIAQLKGEKTLPKRRLMGTPLYMSPEQKEDAENISFSSDIYSLGIIAYELLMGRLSQGNIQLDSLPPELRKILEKALQPFFKDRYQDTVDFITDISTFLKNFEEETFHPEKSGIHHFFHEVLKMQEKFFIPQMPDWKDAALGYAVLNISAKTAFYCDFFTLPKDRYAVVMAEPTRTGYSSIFAASELRGMLRALFEEHGAEMDFHPAGLLQPLQKLVATDPIKEEFALSLLFLHPEKNHLSFVSLGHNSLWQIPNGFIKPRVLMTPNHLLGKEENTAILETTNHWQSGDILLLYSLSCFTKYSLHEKIINPEEFLAENIHLKPQKLAEMLLDKLLEEKTSLQDRTSAVICIQRK